MKKKEENLLVYVPVHTTKHQWELLEDGIVQIQIERKAWLDRVVRFFAKTPKIMKIDLDAYGSRVWLEIDGVKNVGAIADKLKAEFGDEVEPLYERLVTYMRILYNNKFISFI